MKRKSVKRLTKEHESENQVLLLFFFFVRIYFFVPYFEKKVRYGHGASGIYVATTTGKGKEVFFTDKRNIPSLVTLISLFGTLLFLQEI